MGSGRGIVIGLVVAALVVGATPVVASAQPVGQPEPIEQSFLAVVDAGNGRYDPGAGKLTLGTVHDRAVWFTDRPGRAAGQYSIAEMISFFFPDGSAPPNAALELAAKDKRGHVTIVEVANPAYDLKKDRLTFDAQVIPDPASALHRTDSALVRFVKRHKGKIPRSFGASTLFVDSANTDGGASTQPDGDVELDGYEGSVTFTGQLTQNNLATDINVDCTTIKIPNVAGNYQFVARDSGDDAVVTDSPRIDSQIDPNAQISWNPTASVEWNHIGSRLATAIHVKVIIWDKTDLTANYKVTVWCAEQEDDAWVIFG
ncbi:MAG TPA: hypothetical protein VIH82_09000 [Acidimicrobiia bacterium]|jgi:hypothetical protein